MKYIDTWDLDAIFPGRTKSPQLQEKIQDIEKNIHTYAQLVNDWDVEHVTADSMKTVLHNKEKLEVAIGQVRNFVQMCSDAYTNDKHASVVMGQIIDLMSQFEKMQTVFMKKIVTIADDRWQNLLEKDEELSKVAFALNEIRREGKRLLSEKEEAIFTELSKDGLTAWSNLYDTTVSIMTIPYTDNDGKTTELSIGQAMNRMYADPDSKVRKQLFMKWEEAWTKFAPIFADTLNHLAGYRLTVQKFHGRESFLDEPLKYNRMSKQTLEAMWQAVEQNKEPFIKFLQQKAKVLGMEKLGWQDVDAPVVLGKEKAHQFTYEEACDFIIENFATFGPKLSSFAEQALKNRWVEAEDRPYKRPGGYCEELPELEESRIFMTFTGSSSDVSTLAHELGHAFHSYVMKDLPRLNRNYAMNVAETASTFAETIVASATVNQAKTNEEKVTLLNAKLENATAMFLNIHARFLFETAFYEERQKGIVSEERLNELMLEAQKKAYCDSLSSWHPHFWCSKLHFFIDDVPFYNFPYTFGYLFCLGIYGEFLKNPEGFEERYIALLKDTGSMKVEELAMKHLGVDLTKKEFWESGIKLIAKDVEQFICLTNNYV